MTELVYTAIIAFIGSGGVALVCLYVMARRGNCWAVTVLGRIERAVERIGAVPGWFGRQARSFREDGKHGKPTPARVRYGIAVKPEAALTTEAAQEAMSS